MTKRTVFITGGASGIGYGIAELMVKQGHHVIVADINEKAAQSAADKLSQFEGTASAIAVDVCNAEQVAALPQALAQSLGVHTVDVLINNAGIQHTAPLAEMPPATWDAILAINLSAAFHTMQAAMPAMAERGFGTMTFLASIAGITGNGAIGTYGITKGANAHLAKNMAIEWGPKGIRSNAIAPGLIKTEFAEALWKNPKLAEATINSTPLRRLGEPDDIAGIAVFLASKAGAFVNGQTIVADGGVTVADRLVGAH